MEKQNKKIYPGLDVGKFLCAFLILFYHYFSEHGPLPGLLNEVLSLYAVAVALFMTISGFLIFDKLSGVKETKERWKIVKHQVVRIYSIYLIWSIPYLIFTISRWDYNSISLSFILGNVQGWLFNSTFYTIWFMPMLAIGLVFTFWLTEKLPPLIVNILAFICYALGALLLTYNFVGEYLNGYNIFSEFAKTWLGGARGWLFYAFPLIMLGRYAVKCKERFKAVPMLVLSIISLGMILGEALLLRKISGIHTGIDLTIMMIPTVFFILGFLISVSIPSGKYCVWMRNISTLIFMSQRLFLTVLPACFPTLFNFIFSNIYFGAIVVIGLTFILAMSIIKLAKKKEIFKKLY